MMDERGFVDKRFTKGVYSAIKEFDPDLKLDVSTYVEEGITHVVNGKETSEREITSIGVEFKKENVYLDLTKMYLEDPYVELRISNNNGDDQDITIIINEDKSVVMEYEEGYAYFPPLSLKGYFYSNESIENYQLLTDDRVDIYLFGESIKEFSKNHILADKTIRTNGLNLKSKLVAALTHAKPTYEKIKGNGAVK